jgi:hypothetical protein
MGFHNGIVKTKIAIMPNPESLAHAYEDARTDT